jgi:hypothetical protein
MSYPIRQGATTKVCIGPAVAVGDGFTPVTNLDLSTADDAVAKLYNNSTVVSIAAYTFAAVTNMDGYYDLTLQSGISNTLGDMTISVRDDSLILPIKACFHVYSPTAYDLLYLQDITGFLRALNCITIGTVDAASTTTSIITSSITPAVSVTDQLKGRIVTFASTTTTAALRGQSTDITASSSGGVLTVTALTTAPVSGDLFTVQ